MESTNEVSTDALLTQLEAESFFARLAAKEELARRKDPASLPRLIGLLEDERPDVRAEAVEILGRFEDPTYLETMATVLEKDPAWEVRFGAVNGLASLRDRRGEPCLASALAGDEWPAVRAQAALALSVFPGCDAARALVAALADPDAQVVTMVRRTLTEITSSREPAAWEPWIEANCPPGPDAEKGAPPPQTSTLGAAAAPAEEDYQYLAWASFEPGSWVIRKSEGRLGGEARETLRSVSPTEVVIEIRKTVEGLGPRPPETRRIPAGPSEGAKSGSPEEYSAESLTLKGQELSCRVRRSSQIAIWYCDATPGVVIFDPQQQTFV